MCFCGYFCQACWFSRQSWYVINLRDAGHSFRAIEEQTGVSYSTARRIAERRGRYLSMDEGEEL